MSKHTIWHAIVAVLLFPIGLIILLFPVKRCLACHSNYGAGNEIAKVIAIGVVCLGALIGLAILGIAATAADLRGF